MLIQSIIYLPSIIGIGLIALFVANRSRERTLRLFSFFAASLCAWLILEYLTDAQVGSGKLWLQLASVVTLVMAAMFVVFSYSYPLPRKMPNLFKVVVVAPVLVFIPISFSPLLVQSVAYTADGVMFDAGPLYIANSLCLFAYMLGGIVILTRRLRHLDYRQREQVYLLIAAIAVALIGNVLAGLVFQNAVYGQMLRPLSILLLVVLVTYAMVFRGLFDIRSYAIRAAAYTLAFGLIGITYIVTALAVAGLVFHTQLEGSEVIYLGAITS
jgi:hypothetical protein